MKGNIYNCVNILIYMYLGLVSHIVCHVCSKQRAESYSTNVDRAFICPERYTTACGQLDWRRCTKYRVSTCYTPTQKYATRYVTVEVCCPGWRGDTCSEPICTESCQNGGVCADLGGHPGCRCQDGYYGDACQHGRNNTNTVQVVLACCAALVTIALLVIAVTKYRRRAARLSHVEPYTIPLGRGGSIAGQAAPYTERCAVPSAPQFNT